MTPTAPPAAAIAPSPRATGFAAALVALTVLVYASTFSAPFVFDDVAAITQNPSLTQLSTAFSPPAGLSVTGRPLVNLSLALNHALSGEAVWSYHALNLALHLACALTLFALLRRVFTLVDVQRSALVAFGATLFWSVHPVQTAAVTYVMQRSELLVSLFALFTLYGLARGGAIHESGMHRSAWLSLSVLACLLGMASKEVMVTVPLVAFLFDRTFLAGSFRAALKVRAHYYIALACTWLLAAWLVFNTDSRGASAGFDAGVAWSDYALRQFYAVALYARLILWPFPLIFDYGSTLVTDSLSLVFSAVIVGALAVVTAICLRRRPAIGFCGAAFFLLLAPTSSVVPIATQTVAEHRIYLASAGAVVLIVLSLHHWFGRRAQTLCLALAVALGALTVERNFDYRSPVSLWSDTVKRRPNNPRAHYNLAVSLIAAGDAPDAITELESTLRVDPAHSLAREKLGRLRLDAGQPAEALADLEFSVRQSPASPAAHFELASALVQLNRVDEAAIQFTETIRLNPTHAAAHYNLGNALAQLGRYEEALSHFEEAARLDPTDVSARNNAARLREYLKK